ncbi:MAG: flagellar basal body P-ring formation chaperone FlgA [Steroidobacteraceae bacterium]
MSENRRSLGHSIRRTRGSPPGRLVLATAVAALGLLCGSSWSQASPRGTVEPVAAIRAAAAAYVHAQLPAAEHAQVTAGALDDRLRLARCGVPLEVQPAAGTAAMARSTVRVGCTAPASWQIFVPVTVVREISVLVLRHAAARGAHLTNTDVNVETRKVTGFTRAFLESPAELRGHSVARMLAAGTPLTADMLTADPVVRRGQQVTLVVQAAGFEVRAVGLALQDAPAGGRLDVENLSSRKVVQGIVASSGIVDVRD